VVVMMMMPMIMVIVIMVVVVVLFMTVMMLPAQQPGAHQVDAETDHSDGDRLVVMDDDRLEHPHRRLVADRKSDQGENDRTGEAREVTSLPVPKAKRGSRAWLRAKR